MRQKDALVVALALPRPPSHVHLQQTVHALTGPGPGPGPARPSTLRLLVLEPRERGGDEPLELVRVRRDDFDRALREKAARRVFSHVDARRRALAGAVKRAPHAPRAFASSASELDALRVEHAAALEPDEV